MPRRARRVAAAPIDIVVIGISTGGPQALSVLIPQLPADCPCRSRSCCTCRLATLSCTRASSNELSALHRGRSARGQAKSRPGTVLPRAGRPAPDASARRRTATVVTHLDVRPLDTPHRPSVDVLFQSAAEVYGARVLGVVMTGWASTAAKARPGSRPRAARS